MLFQPLIKKVKPGILISLAETWLSRLQMDVHHNFSGLTKNQRPSNLGNKKVGHGIFKMLEDQTTCIFGTLTLDGSNFSSMKMDSLSTSKTTRFLMSLEEEMLKVTMFKSGERMVQKLKSGQFCMKIKSKEEEDEELTSNSILKSTDHSILFQNCQWEELLHA
jgi:hypothetical protein